MAVELAKAGETYPLGRLANVDDIANMILFLASDDGMLQFSYFGN